MNYSAVTHFSDYTYAYAISKDTLNIRLKVGLDQFNKIGIYYKNLYDHSDKIFYQEMNKILTTKDAQMYETSITLKERHFKYYFELITNEETIFFTADGFTSKAIPANYFYYPVINYDDILSLPSWASGGLIYQVLVDRFFDGNRDNNPPLVKNVNCLPDRNTYYGGDFAGLIEKLDYIKSLGVKIIYLSPVFQSPTYHKYDVQDYYQIEAIYGGEKGLKQLVNQVHQYDMKIILDVAFNHCSILNELFQDVIKNGEKSKYAKWFIIDSFPLNLDKCNYDSFAGVVPSMPRFDTSNKEVSDYLVNVALDWTKKLEIDGWRLDVGDEVATSLWRELHRKLKEYNPDIILIGEIWNVASKWMQGDQFDSVTNYKYRSHFQDFLTDKIDSTSFWNLINANKLNYKTPSWNYLINLLGSHDTIRSFTFLQDRDLHFLAIKFTLTFEGMPLIYYGDEIGMEGDVDPDNRRVFNWDLINNSDTNSIKELSAFRIKSEILKKGSLTAIKTNSKVLAFIRTYKEQSLLVVANFTTLDQYLEIKVKNSVFGNSKILDNCLLVNKMSLSIFEI
jgi:glycosidase